jgi:hypothetical protein
MPIAAVQRNRGRQRIPAKPLYERGLGLFDVEIRETTRQRMIPRRRGARVPQGQPNILLGEFFAAALE